MLRVGMSEGRGRGVFATRAIAAGETIEEAPVIVLPPEELEAIKRTALYNYFFQWTTPNGPGCAICLGLGSIYNHSPSPNARYVRLFDERVIRFLALRNIKTGEEIFTNYNGDAKSKREVWFAHAQV